ncbi:MAG: hypothetical protein MI867_03300 [Pseudomonadales bacterium]|nr:hypothetical protein [Pseudomonadales bacterium]
MIGINPEIDYLGRWFEVRRTLGIEDAIAIGRVDLSSGTVEWKEYAHAEWDGMGALSHFLESVGYGPQELLNVSHPQPNSIWKRIALAFNPFGTEKPVPTLWNNYDDSTNGESVLAWKVLSSEQSKIIENNFKDQSVSESSYFLWSLNKTVKQLLKNDDILSWFLPVNLRGPFRKSNPRANHSSGIYFNVSGSASPNDVQQKIRVQLKQNRQWGLLYQTHIGALLGPALMRYILNKTIRESRYVGSLSMLGEWPIENSVHKNANEAILICAPGSPMYPIATGVIKWKDQYTLCLRINPALQQTQQQVEDMLERWVDHLCNITDVNLIQ